MAKDGISLKEVRKARDQLLRQRLKPSVRKILTKTGGSNTIQTQLLEFETKSKGESFGEQGMLQASLPDSQSQLQEMLQEEVGIAHTEAQSKIEVLQAHLRIERLSNGTLLNELARALTEHENADRALTKMSERHAEATEMAHRLKERLDAKTRELTYLNNEVVSMKQMLKLRSKQLQESEERQRRDSVEFARQQAAHKKVLAVAETECTALLKQLAKEGKDRLAMSLDYYFLAHTTEAQIADRDRQLITLSEDLKSVHDELSKALEREMVMNTPTDGVSNLQNHRG
ncbi:DNA-binding protein [Pseudomonas sp. BMS12]|uniref:DNA-binding protein n=1 Tax=Pseudomonas sp. BMS12 TaxID=1796033 RepID=UPI00083AF2BC|nr:hypothetical protein [Pseudomonas sp. BMS12]